MKEAKITICMASYKQDDKFRLCLESLLNQTYKDFILEIYEDGPDEGTKQKIVNEYDDDRIRLYQTDERENIYGGRARYCSVINCQTEWWATTNGDNIHSPLHFETMMKYSHFGYDIIKGTVAMADFIPYFYPNETKEQHKEREDKAIKMLLKDWNINVKDYLPVIPCLKTWLDELMRVDATSFLVRTELIKKTGGWHYHDVLGEKWACDWDTYSAMLAMKPKIKYLNEELLVLHR